MGKLLFSANNYFPLKFNKETLTWAEEKFHQHSRNHPPAFSQKTCKKETISEMEEWAKTLHNQNISDLVVIGVGGSALGAKALEAVIRHAYIGKEKYRLHFWEGTHPTAIAKVLHHLENRKVSALLVSKSGTTLESRTMLALFRQFFPESSVTFVTSYPDKLSDVRQAQEAVFLIPEKLGGRFSVISPVGLLPTAFLEGNLHTFVGNFYQITDKTDFEIPWEENPAKQVALAYYSLFTKGLNTHVLWSYSRELALFMDWIVQLWAESLGKNELVRAFPVPAKGPEDQHSVLQYFMSSANEFVHTFFHVESYGAYSVPVPIDFPVISAGKSLWQILQAQMTSIEKALTQNKRPVAEVIMGTPSVAGLARQMAFWMRVVAYLAALYEVNPYDQPGVELGKKYCKELLSGQKDEKPLEFIFELA